MTAPVAGEFRQPLAIEDRPIPSPGRGHVPMHPINVPDSIALFDAAQLHQCQPLVVVGRRAARIERDGAVEARQRLALVSSGQRQRLFDAARSATRA